MISLEIVTPERSLLDVKCDLVSLPGTDGEFQVLQGHAPMLSGIKIGILSFSMSGGKESLGDLSFGSGDELRLMVAGGFAEVGDDKVRVLCDAAALPGEVDARSERELISKLEEKLKKVDEGDNKEFSRIEAEIERAMAKLLLV